MRRFLIWLAPLAMLGAGTAHAGDWSTLTTSEEVAYQVGNVLDWGTTRSIAHAWDTRHVGCAESATQAMTVCTDYGFGAAESQAAWLIGAHPTYGSINALMLGSAVIHFTVSRLLLAHPVAEQLWQSVTIAGKWEAVGVGFHVGYRFQW